MCKEKLFANAQQKQEGENKKQLKSEQSLYCWIPPAADNR